MRLNKPIITIALIIIMVFNLIFFSLNFIGKTFTNKSFLYSIVDKFDFYKYISNDEEIIKSVEEYKYPMSIFEYINYNKVNEIKDEFVDNLLNDKEILIDNSKIRKILNNSVSKYEIINEVDIINNVEKNIEDVSFKISNEFNNDLNETYRLFRFLSYDAFTYLFGIILLLLTIGIIIIERRNGFLICSIIYITYSLIIYWVDKNFFTDSLFISFNSTYFNDMSNNTLMLGHLYMICFILGFVLLLIYIIKMLKRMFRNLRLYSYGYYWR